MSLLDNGPDSLTVRPEIMVIDERRNKQRVPGDVAFVVTGRLQPISAEEPATDGQQVDTLYRFICRDFPAGPWAAVSGVGRDWDVVGEPEPRNGSERTRHCTVTLRARTVRSV